MDICVRSKSNDKYEAALKEFMLSDQSACSLTCCVMFTVLPVLVCVLAG